MTGSGRKNKEMAGSNGPLLKFSLRWVRPAREADMRTIHILKAVALLVLGALSANAEDSGTEVDRGYENVIEEIVVTGKRRCGSWPIDHLRIRDCEFAELIEEILPKVLETRPKLFHTCLSCEGNRCVARAWPEDRLTEELICKRLFWTPTRIVRSMISGDNLDLTRVDFTYAISVKGRVEDVEIVSFESESELNAAEVLRLIEDGAVRTRFAPVTIAETVYKIVGLKEAFILGD